MEGTTALPPPGGTSFRVLVRGDARVAPSDAAVVYAVSRALSAASGRPVRVEPLGPGEETGCRGVVEAAYPLLANCSPGELAEGMREALVDLLSCGAMVSWERSGT